MYASGGGGSGWRVGGAAYIHTQASSPFPAGGKTTKFPVYLQSWAPKSKSVCALNVSLFFVHTSLLYVCYEYRFEMKKNVGFDLNLKATFFEYVESVH